MKSAWCWLPVVCGLGTAALGCSRAGPPAAQPAADPGAPGASVGGASLTAAQRDAERFIIVDGHVDLPFRLEMSLAEGHVTEDVSTRTPKGDFDLVRARQGGLDA